MRPQVCGRSAAAIGAAIFGDFGAARETVSRAALSPPAAGPESPAGRGTEVTDGGRRARSSPYLVKEPADWPSEQRGGGGAAPAPPRGGGRRGGCRSPPPRPALRGSQGPRRLPARPGCDGPGWGMVRGGGVPVSAEVGGAELDARRAGQGRPPPGKNPPKPGVRGRGGAWPQVERAHPSLLLAQGLRKHRILRPDFSVLQRGTAKASPKVTAVQGRPCSDIGGPWGGARAGEQPGSVMGGPAVERAPAVALLAAPPPSGCAHPRRDTEGS